jgi:hypothetical protein
VQTTLAPGTAAAVSDFAIAGLEIGDQDLVRAGVERAAAREKSWPPPPPPKPPSPPLPLELPR